MCKSPNASDLKVVILVNPSAEHQLSMRIGDNTIKAAATQMIPPVNILLLAAALRKNVPVVKVVVVDFMVEPFSSARMRDVLLIHRPVLVGVTSFSTSLLDAVNVCRAVKEISVDIPVVVGGAHVKVFPKETVELPSVDYVCEGDGEITIVRWFRPFLKENP